MVARSPDSIMGLAQRWIRNRHLREVLGGASADFTVRSASTLVGLLLYAILGQRHGAAAVGLYALTTSVAELLCLFVSLGTMRSAVRLVAAAAATDQAAAERTGRRILQATVPLSVAAGALLFVLSPSIVNRLFDMPEALRPLQAVAIALPFLSIRATMSGCLRGLKRVGLSMAVQDLIPHCLMVGILLVMGLFLEPNATLPIFAYGVAAVVSAVVSFAVFQRLACRKTAREAQPVRPAGWSPSLREIVKVSMPMAATSLLFFLLGRTALFVLGMHHSAETVGAYAMAGKIAVFVTYPSLAIMSIGAPKFAEAFRRRQHDELRHVTLLTSALLFWLTLPCFLAIAALAKPILWLFGKELVAGSGPLVLLCSALMLNAACGPVGYLMEMTNRERLWRNNIAAGLVVCVALNFLLIPRYHLMGAAVADLAAAVFWNLLSSFYAWKEFGFWAGYLPGRRISPATP